METNGATHTKYRIGEVYNMFFEGTGSEQSGWRPGVVFQNNIGNAHSPNLIAIPLTSSIKKMEMPTHVFISSVGTGLRLDSVAICENPKCISKTKVGKYITTLSDDYMKRIAIAYLLATSAISFIDLQSLVNAWTTAVRMNVA